MVLAIGIDNLSFSFDNGQELFKGLSLQINRGEWLSLIGRNGSGKSTLMRLILGLETPSSGTIKVAARLGAVFQNPEDQFIGATVEDELAFGLENQQIDPGLMPNKIKDTLQEIGMSDYAKSSPDQLSGGQKQRVAIGSALILNTDVLFFDEATSMLDPLAKESIINLIGKLHRRNPNLTIINITHDPDEILEGQRVAVLERGKIIADRPTRLLMSDVDFLRHHQLGETFVSELISKINQKRTLDQKIPSSIISKKELLSWLSNSNK
ncbi:ATP-binding cassette domain-containing protein [Oenococcus sp. UCMA 17063]|nr:ATP-binding cassette domain-containing protein [Oenococcus sp. UCMA 17063]